MRCNHSLAASTAIKTYCPIEILNILPRPTLALHLTPPPPPPYPAKPAASALLQCRTAAVQPTPHPPPAIPPLPSTAAQEQSLPLHCYTVPIVPFSCPQPHPHTHPNASPIVPATRPQAYLHARPPAYPSYPPHVPKRTHRTRHTSQAYLPHAPKRTYHTSPSVPTVRTDVPLARPPTYLHHCPLDVPHLQRAI